MSSSNKAVAAKIIKAWGHIGSIPKNGKNANFNYKFVREEDAADALRNAFMKVGLSCVPSVEKLDMKPFTTAKGTVMNHVIVTMKFTLTDQDTGDSESFTMVGEAMDVQDKAVYKAITGCTKYAYVKLAMSGAEDNEEEDVGERTEAIGDPNIQGNKPKPIQQGATYRKPESAAQPAPKGNQPVEKTDSQSPARVDKPMSTQTEPAPKQEELTGSEVPIMEDSGKITSVVPTMKNKPASISFKRKDGTVIPITFDPKVIDVPKILKFLNEKVDVNIVCDISSGNPHLMSIEGV